MPFRSFHTDVLPGKPVHLYTAEEGDCFLEVRATGFGDDNLSVGFSFKIGGPDMAETGGLACFNSVWSSEVETGDEVWIDVMPAAFTNITPITCMVRSKAKPTTQKLTMKPATTNASASAGGKASASRAE